jgi:hypothetical protein
MENKEKAELIKKALKLVDELGDIDIDITDIDEMENFVNRALKIKRNPLWKLN